ncbi:MAG: DJ-1/PfpI family protein [Candidatus Pacebacteria bacterium]|nr:DJ-1/PfpI family protein [Candidatus Paceibacterota bacterium]
MPEKNLTGKQIAIVVSFKDFRDEEYFVPKEILTAAGAKIKTVSTKGGLAVGADGGEAEIDLLISEINIAKFADLQSKSSHDSIQSISSFDAVVFIGGPGALKYLDNEDFYKLARETIAQDKVLAAICISPVILAKAGVLEGKRATVWSSPMDKEPIRTLKDYGAVYQDAPVVIDGKIITGNGPAAAKRFTEAIVMLLTEI